MEGLKGLGDQVVPGPSYDSEALKTGAGVDVAASHSKSEPDWALRPAQKVSEGLLGTITEPQALTEHSSDATGHRHDMVPIAIGMSVITASLSAPSRLQAGSQRPRDSQFHCWCAGEPAFTCK